MQNDSINIAYVLWQKADCVHPGTKP